MIKHTQIICRPLPMNCLSMFDYFVELTLEGLKFRLTSDDIWDQDQSLIDFNTKKVLTNPLNVNSSEHLHHQQQSIYIQLSCLLSFCDYRLASAYVSINNSRKDIFSIGFIENNKLRILNTARKKNVARNLMTFVRIFFFSFDLNKTLWSRIWSFLRSKLTQVIQQQFYVFCPFLNQFISDPVGIYLLKVNNKNFRRSKTCSKLIIKTPERHQWCRSGIFIVNFEHIPHLVLVFLLWTINM